MVLAGLLAREFGGGRLAQGLAALAVWCGPIFLATGELFETVVFDQLCWTLTLWLAVRAWTREPGWLWLLVGWTAGVGLEVKFTMGMCGPGLAAALLFTATGRRHLRTLWPWLGGALALILLVPNLWWQHTHGWPTAEFVRNNNAWNREEWSLAKFALSQVEFVSPAGFVLAAWGLWWAFTRHGADAAKVAGWVFFISLTVLLATLGKSYYLGAAYPGLLAAGAVAAGDWTGARLLAGRDRWLRPASVGTVVVLALPALPLVLPLVPPARLPGSWVLKAQHDYGEMFGWQELTAEVEDVFPTCPRKSKATRRC